jgi:hypothetical protein
MESSEGNETTDDEGNDAKEQRQNYLEDKAVSRFLERIGERSLIPLFSQQRITMKMLMDLGHADLREVGVGIFGQRYKILTAVARLKRGKCTIIYLIAIHS